MDEDTLRTALHQHIMNSPEAMGEIARSIGIDLVTLKNFLHKKKPCIRRSLVKMREWVKENQK